MALSVWRRLPVIPRLANFPLARGRGIPTFRIVNDDALPVAVDLADSHLAQDVCAHVESVLGWQVVEPGPHLPIRLLLADQVDRDHPTVVVTTNTDPQGWQTHLRQGALEVLLWPTDAGRLPDAVPLLAGPPPAGQIITVAASSAGVGASTVALSLGAHHAWRGRRTVVLTDPSGMALAGLTPDGSGVIAGITGLTVAPDLPAVVAGERPDILVADRGVGTKGHVLVGVPDAALLRVLPQQDGGTLVVTCGQGGLRTAELRRALKGHRHVMVERSFRVARAGLRGRVPVALPGGYLAALGTVADAVSASPPAPTPGWAQRRSAAV